MATMMRVANARVAMVAVATPVNKISKHLKVKKPRFEITTLIASCCLVMTGKSRYGNLDLIPRYPAPLRFYLNNFLTIS